MSRYTQSRTRLSRRVGKNLFLKGPRSFSAKDDFSKKPFKVGKKDGRPARIKLSEYGKQLQEKQAIRYSYGLQEKQFANLFKKAFTMKGDTGKTVLSLLERRLDNVVYRAGLANSRSQSRQLVNHGHFLVNGVKVNIPSYVVQVGDVIKVKENKKSSEFWKNFQLLVPNESPAWIDSSKTLEVKVINLPLDSDLPQEFSVSPVVEYYSRKVR